MGLRLTYLVGQHLMAKKLMKASYFTCGASSRSFKTVIGDPLDGPTA
jgi:hypothetical protein